MRTGRPRSHPIIPRCQSSPQVKSRNVHRTPSVPMGFVCELCEELIREPLVTKCCRKNVCTPCLYEWQKMEGTVDDSEQCCLLCHTPGFKFAVDDELQQRMKETVVPCRNKSLGCTWSGGLTELSVHLQADDGCPYASIRCPQNCGKLVCRNVVTEHLLSDCIFVWCKCEYCSDLVQKELLEEHKKTTCPSYTLACPNDCGTRVKRSQLPQHAKECPLAETNCPFKEAGCGVVMRRKESLDHQEQGHTTHLLQAFQYLHTEVTSMKSQLQNTQQVQREMADELLKAKQELAVARMMLQQQKAHTHLITTTLHTELGYFLPSCACQALAMECARTQLGMMADPMYAFLHHGGPVLTFRLSGYLKIKESDKPWYSPPFYIKDGYKMCLGVHLNGDQEGRGTHISVHIHLMAGEHDSNLRWPLAYNEEVMVSIMRQHNVEQKQRGFFPTTSPANLRRRTNTARRLPTQNRVQSLDSADQSSPHSDFPFPAVMEQHIIRSLVFNLYCVQKPPGSIGLSFGHVALFCMQSCIDNTVLSNDSLVFQVETHSRASAVSDSM